MCMSFTLYAELVFFTQPSFELGSGEDLYTVGCNKIYAT